MINAKLLQLVVDASCEGIVVAEQEGDDNILIYANQAFEVLTGYPVNDILYRDCRFLQGDERHQPGLHLIREALARHEPCRQVLRNYRKDGTPFWNELSITPVFNEAEHLTYYIGIQKDVTREVEAERRIIELETELENMRQELAALKKVTNG